MAAKNTVKIRWDQSKVEQVKGLVALGLVHDEVAAAMGISKEALYAHRRKNDAVEQAFRDGRASSKAAILNAMMQRALQKGLSAQRAGEYLMHYVHGAEGRGRPEEEQDATGRLGAPGGQTIDVQAEEDVRELSDQDLVELIHKLGGKRLA